MRETNGEGWENSDGKSSVEDRKMRREMVWAEQMKVGNEYVCES